MLGQLLGEHPDPGKAGTDAAHEAHLRRLRDGERCQAAALGYLAAGMAALALCPPDHAGVSRVSRGHARDCGSPGKRPWHTWREHQDRLPTADEVRAWWRALPNSNVGVALGPVSGLVGVDVDDAEGERLLAEASGGELPPTAEFRTPGNAHSRRLLYAIPPGAELRTTHQDLRDKRPLSFLAKGSQTAMPPSRHPNGGLYEWVPGRSPAEVAFTPAPDWLLRELAPERSRPAGGKARPGADGAPIPEGRRDRVLTSMAGSMRRVGFGEEAIRAALAVENAARCRPPLDEAQVEKIARSVARYKPSAVPAFVIRRGELPQPRHAHATISFAVEV